MLQNALHASSAAQVMKAKRAAGVLRLSFGCAMACFTLAAIQAANAQTAAPAAAPAAPATWESSIKYSGEIDGGVSGNFDSPGSGINFGQSSTDHANQATLNALFLTIERDPNTSTSTFDWGFKVQGEYGSDVRYNRYFGEFNHQDLRYMGEISQAYLDAHGASFFSGGYDITLGQFVTPLGDEVIFPRTNPFYSHSYIYSYGLPVNETGGELVIHPAIADIYLGGDTGINTTIGSGGNAGDSSPSYLFGLGKSIGNWTLLILGHSGPAPFEGNKKYRTYVDTVDSYKVNSALTLTTEGDYVYDAAYRATAYGGTEYASYTLNSTTTLNGRIEVFNDAESFFVFNPTADNGEFTAQGLVAPGAASRSATTYGEITLGVTYSPPNLPGPLSTLEFRPEVRFDDALKGAGPFDTNSDGTDGKKSQVTVAADADLTF